MIRCVLGRQGLRTECVLWSVFSREARSHVIATAPGENTCVPGALVNDARTLGWITSIAEKCRSAALSVDVCDRTLIATSRRFDHFCCHLNGRLIHQSAPRSPRVSPVQLHVSFSVPSVLKNSWRPKSLSDATSLYVW